MELKGKKINFLGDSITEGVGCSDPTCKIYHQLLAKKVGLAEARNYGVSGTRFATQKVPLPGAPESFDWDFLTRAKEMDKDADVVVVFGGTNDFGHGDAPIGKPDDRTQDTFYGACHALFSYLVSAYPASRIVIMTPLHRFNDWNLKGDIKTTDVGTLKDYVDIEREVAEYYSIPVLDLFKNAGICPTIDAQRELYTADGLHPNDLGYQKIADMLEIFLKNL